MMTEYELALWQKLRTDVNQTMVTENWIYVALEDGLLSMPHPKKSIQWGHTDHVAVIGGFKVYHDGT